MAQSAALSSLASSLTAAAEIALQASKNPSVSLASQLTLSISAANRNSQNPTSTQVSNPTTLPTTALSSTASVDDSPTLSSFPTDTSTPLISFPITIGTACSVEQTTLASVSTTPTSNISPSSSTSSTDAYGPTANALIQATFTSYETGDCSGKAQDTTNWSNQQPYHNIVLNSGKGAVSIKVEGDGNNIVSFYTGQGATGPIPDAQNIVIEPGSSCLSFNAYIESFYYPFQYVPPGDTTVSRRDEPLEMIQFKDCYVRFQIVEHGQDENAAKVTKTDWDTTTEQVNYAITHYGDTGGIQLWLPGTEMGLLYAGFYKDPAIRMDPQNGLNGDRVMMSIILPSGKAKLEEVKPQKGGDVSQVDIDKTSMITGIALRDPNNPLIASDYAYQMTLYDSPSTTMNSKLGLKRYLSDWVSAWKAGRKVTTIGFTITKGDGTEVMLSISGLCL